MNGVPVARMQVASLGKFNAGLTSSAQCDKVQDMNLLAHVPLVTSE